MIDEKVLVERLEEQKSDWNADYNVPINDAIKIVNQLAEESNNGWIPCSERLPKKDEYVLCSLNENNPTIIHTVIIARYDSADYWHNGIVLAWQPLPAPYQPKE